ncbi:UNVERIFIED_ORG: HNH endonuclease, partial [Bacillus sp. AZ43]
ASADRAPGEPGAMSAERRAGRPEVLAGVSEWAAQELVVALSISRAAAEAELARALTLVHRLPGVLAALEGGVLHAGHLWPLLERVAPVADARVRRELERDLLAWVASRDVTTPAQLGAKVRREVLRRDAGAVARELAAALRRRGISARPARAEGMAVLEALLTVPEAEALLDALGRYADALDDGEGPARTRGQKMADCLLDLVLRPGQTDLPAVRAQLTLVAPVATALGGEAPGEVGGRPVPAAVVRALADALDLLDEPTADEPTDARPPADEPTAEADERWWAEVEARALRGEWRGADDPPREELERWWAEEARWADEETLPGPAADLCDDEPAEDLATWSAADRAVEQAGATLLELDRQLSRARTAVSLARWAEAAEDEGRERSPAGRLSAAPDAITALTTASRAQRAALADLLDRTAGGGLVDRPRIAVTDALTGALLALTDAPDLRRRARDGDGLGPPGAGPGYRPNAALDRHVRARDRRCRFPGCRNRVPTRGELDHHVPWPDGPTTAGNLTGFCTTDHRGKHQAPGWRYRLTGNAVLTVTTPSGLTATSHPPPF